MALDNSEIEPSEMTLDDEEPIQIDAGSKKVIYQLSNPTIQTLHENFKDGDLQTKKGSVLQTAIIAGTMGAKKTSDLIPLCHLVSTVAHSLHHLHNIPCRAYSKVLTLRCSKTTALPLLLPTALALPPGQSYCHQVSFFRYHVQKGDIKVVPISTPHQHADIFTKGLTKGPFEAIRKLLLSW